MSEELDAATTAEAVTPEQVDLPNEAESAPAQPDPADEGHKSKGGFQNRIDKLTREKYQLAEELERERQARAEYERKLQQPQPQPAQQEYSSYEEFVAAQARQAALDAVREQSEQQQKQQAEQKQRETHRQLVTDFLSSANQLAAEVNDFEDVAGSVQVGGTAVGQALLMSDRGAQLSYYLGANPQELMRIEQASAGNPIVAARELTRLEAKAEALIKSRSKSSASPQGKPLGVSPAVNSSAPSDRDSVEDWIRKRRAQKYGR